MPACLSESAKSIAEDTEELCKAFDRYAPHFDGDRKYDSKWLAKQMVG